jgi:hypothetical protein
VLSSTTSVEDVVDDDCPTAGRANESEILDPARMQQLAGPLQSQALGTGGAVLARVGGVGQQRGDPLGTAPAQRVGDECQALEVASRRGDRSDEHVRAGAHVLGHPGVEFAVGEPLDCGCVTDPISSSETNRSYPGITRTYGMVVHFASSSRSGCTAEWPTYPPMSALIALIVTMPIARLQVDSPVGMRRSRGEP